MEFPRVGVGLPNYGPYASPESILTVATAVEALGFHSVSTFERLLLPATPGWRNNFGLPEYPVYDAIETLTWVAAQTHRIKLGTGILLSLFQPPVVLARRLATLDQHLPPRDGTSQAVQGNPRDLRRVQCRKHVRGVRARERCHTSCLSQHVRHLGSRVRAECRSARLHPRRPRDRS